MTRFAIGICCLAMIVVVSGCSGDAAPKVAAKADVAGTVTLDGNPMDGSGAEISFALGGQAPVRLPIKAGKFEGKAPVGETRVEIRAFREGERAMMDGKPIGDPVKENFVAEQFNDKSTLTAKIEAGGSKALKFEVVSKK